MFRKYLKPQNIPYLGELTDAFFTTLPFFGIYSSLSLTVILYTQTSKWLLTWFPWMNLWKFMLLVGLALTIALLLAYKYIVPSLWHSRSKRMTHLEQKIDMIVGNAEKEQGKNKTPVVAVSGGFDPIHPGHIAYIEDALKLGGYVLVILTRDDQLIEKDKLAGQAKNRKPVPFDVRKATLDWGLNGRGEVVENIDRDITSCESLRKYHPEIFAKGGDSWDLENLPERAVCEELGIKIIFGVGGFDKPYTSSQLAKGW